jgi:hypothetical protein
VRHFQFCIFAVVIVQRLSPPPRRAKPVEVSGHVGRCGHLDTGGAIDQNNPFFQSLGTNGRSLRPRVTW